MTLNLVTEISGECRGLGEHPCGCRVLGDSGGCLPCLPHIAVDVGDELHEQEQQQDDGRDHNRTEAEGDCPEGEVFSSKTQHDG